MLTFRLLELVAPTEDTRLGAVMLGLGLVAPLHPDAGHRGVDVDVLRTQRKGLLAGGGLVMLATLKELPATLLLAPIGASAEDWYPSRYGADDTLGAVNLLTPDHVKRAARLVKTGKTYSLGVVTGPTTPAYGPRKFNLTVMQLSDGTGTPLGSNRATGNDDLLYTFVGIGSQIDAPNNFVFNQDLRLHRCFCHRAAICIEKSGLNRNRFTTFVQSSISAQPHQIGPGRQPIRD